MEEEHKTDRKLLQKGVKFLMIALPLLFLGPIILNSSFKNQAHPFFYVICGFAITICLTAMFLLFRGIQTIMKSLFSH
ncbi:MAG: DUF6095 family protein [Flavobacteriaceae bacterium]|jgi:hypothetical protein|nr:DUF6095 family protein [Flavobacteriaceae bacterium]